MGKTVKLLEKFLSSYELENVCRIWVDNEPDDHDNYWVYMVLDKDWYYSSKPDFIVRRMKQGLRELINNYLGLYNIQVGITFEDCGIKDSINEEISPRLKRRITLYDFNEELRNVLDYEINAYLYTNVSDFISDVCDTMYNNLVDSFRDYKPTPKENDELYYFLVYQFSEKIKNYYDRTLKRRANESVKKIIVTESQYKRLFEQKQTKIEMFQDLINDKLEYIRGFCNEDLSAENYGGDVGFGSCDNVAVIDSIKVDEVDTMTGARTDMSGNLYDSTPSIYIKFTINYDAIITQYDFDDVVYDLKHMLRKSTGGLSIVFDYRTKRLNSIKDW